jgi:acylglycerol lipase
MRMRTADSLELHTVAWVPTHEPRAALLIVHGLGEHIGRYDHVGRYFMEQGYAVYGIDHRGHGKSGGERVYFERFELPVLDLKQYVDGFMKQHPGKTLLMYAHSLGSLIGLSFLLRFPSVVQAAVIQGTTLAVETQQSPVVLALAPLINRLAPRMGIGTPLPPDVLSRDSAVATQYANDPLTYHGPVRIRMGHQIVTESRAVRAGLSRLTIPIRVQHGSADQLCPPVGSQMLYDGAGSTDKSLHFYADHRHELHNEIGKEIVLQDSAQWYATHLQPEMTR